MKRRWQIARDRVEHHESPGSSPRGELGGGEQRGLSRSDGVSQASLFYQVDEGGTYLRASDPLHGLPSSSSSTLHPSTAVAPPVWGTYVQGSAYEEGPYVGGSAYGHADCWERPSETEAEEEEAWQHLLMVLESKCLIDMGELQFRQVISWRAGIEVWLASLWQIDVVVKKIPLALSVTRSCSPPPHASGKVGGMPSPSRLPDVLAEQVTLLKSLRHPNCVLFLGYTNPPQFSVVTEYLSRGSLKDLIQSKNGSPISGPLIHRIALSIARGMNYLHTLSVPLVHGRLSSENVYCQENGEIKVANYGLDRVLATSPVPALPSDDIYAFGIILWELLTSVALPQDLTWTQETDGGPCVHEYGPLSLPAGGSPLVRRLIEECWHPDISSRPQFHDIIERLAPLEKKLSAVGQQLFLREQTLSECTERIHDAISCMELFSLRPQQAFASTVRFYCNLSSCREALAIIQKSIVTTESEPVHEGTLVLKDPQGAILWINRLPHHQTTSCVKAGDEKARTLHHLTQHAVSPLSSEFNHLLSFDLCGSPTHALLLQVAIQENYRESSLTLFGSVVIPSLARDIYSWCGALLLLDVMNNNTQVICLFSDEREMDQLLRQGHFHAQLNSFKRILMNIPGIHRYSVELSTFEGRPSPLRRAPNSPNHYYRPAVLPFDSAHLPRTSHSGHSLHCRTPSEPILGLAPRRKVSLGIPSMPTSPRRFHLGSQVRSAWHVIPSAQSLWKVFKVSFQRDLPDRRRMKKMTSQPPPTPAEYATLVILAPDRIIQCPPQSWVLEESQRKIKIPSILSNRCHSLFLRDITGLMSLIMDASEPAQPTGLIIESVHRKNWFLFHVQECGGEHSLTPISTLADGIAAGAPHRVKCVSKRLVLDRTSAPNTPLDSKDLDSRTYL